MENEASEFKKSFLQTPETISEIYAKEERRCCSEPLSSQVSSTAPRHDGQHYPRRKKIFL